MANRKRRIPDGQCCGKCLHFSLRIKHEDTHKCTAKTPPMTSFPDSVNKALNRVDLPRMWMTQYEGLKCPCFEERPTNEATV